MYIYGILGMCELGFCYHWIGKHDIYIYINISTYIYISGYFLALARHEDSSAGMKAVRHFL